MDIGTIASAGLGLIGGIGQLFGARKRRKQLEELERTDPVYQANPIAAQRLAYARNLINARMPGAAAAERNIFQNQANATASVDRNATDSGQALAMAAGLQGQTNQAFGNLEQQENESFNQRLGYLTQAEEGQIGEQDKAFQDSTRRWQDKAQIQGAIAQNKNSFWQSLQNFGFGAMNFGLAGGFQGGGLGGGTTNNNYTSSNLRPSTSMKTVSMTGK